MISCQGGVDLGEGMRVLRDQRGVRRTASRTGHSMCSPFIYPSLINECYLDPINAINVINVISVIVAVLRVPVGQYLNNQALDD
jgi:hypothetical protein